AKWQPTKGRTVTALTELSVDESEHTTDGLLLLAMGRPGTGDGVHQPTRHGPMGEPSRPFRCSLRSFSRTTQRLRPSKPSCIERIVRDAVGSARGRSRISAALWSCRPD